MSWCRRVVRAAALCAAVVSHTAPAASGNAVGPAFEVARTAFLTNSLGPALATDASGAFVAVWSHWDNPPDGDSNIFARRYGPNGAPLGAAFRVDTGAEGLSLAPAVAMDPNGGFMIVWEGGIPGQGHGLIGRHYQADGTPSWNPVMLVPLSWSGQMPSVSVDAEHNTHVAWNERNPATGRLEIRARSFNMGYHPLPTAHLVASDPDADQFLGALRADRHGGTAVAWSSGDEVFVRCFDRNGQARSTALRLNGPAERLTGPVGLDMNGAGGTVVSWTSRAAEGEPSLLRAQRVDRNCVQRGAVVLPDAGQVSGSQVGFPVAVNDFGHFLLTWAGDFAVFARMFHENGAPASGIVTVAQDSLPGHFEGFGMPALGAGTGTVLWRRYYDEPYRESLWARRFEAPPAPTSVDLELRLDLPDGPITTEQGFIARFRVINHSGVAATDATLTFAIPDGATPRSLGTDGWYCPGVFTEGARLVRCTRDQVPPGESRYPALDLHLRTEAPGPWAMSGSVEAAQPDPVPANNEDSGLVVPGDSTPDPFTLADPVDQPTGTEYLSEVITISGIDVVTPVRIGNGYWQKNAGAFTRESGSVVAGDTLRVRTTTSGSANATVESVLVVGSFSEKLVTRTGAADTTPAPFSFDDLTGLQFGVTRTSEARAISGINVATPVHVVDGTWRKNRSGSFTAASGSVVAGDVVEVRHVTASTPRTLTRTTLTVGSFSEQFTSTTAAVDDTPDPFTLRDLFDQPTGVLRESDARSIAGLSEAVPLRLSGPGAYRVNEGPWRSDSSAVRNGDVIRVRHQTSNDSGGMVTSTVTIGGFQEGFSTTTGNVDRTPAPFAFPDLVDQPTRTERLSEPRTIEGLGEAVPITVTGVGGTYSKNGSPFTSEPGTVSNGDAVQVRHVTSDKGSTRVTTTLSVGNFSESFHTVTGPTDTTPARFAFSAQAGVPRDAVRISALARISGTNAPAPIEVSGGLYQLDGGPFTDQPGLVAPGQGVRVQHRSASGPLEQRETLLTVGGTSAVFRTTTDGPAAFSFPAQEGVEPGSTRVSAPVVLSGIASTAPLAVSGGEYSLGCTGAFTAAPATVRSGQQVCLRHVAAGFSGEAVTTLTVGTVSGAFRSVTRAADITPDALPSESQAPVRPGSVRTSAPVTITGIEIPVAISVENGEYGIGCADFTAQAGTIAEGQTVCLRHVASGSDDTEVQTRLAVGAATATFTSRTLVTDTQPDAYDYVDVGQARARSTVDSNVVTISGINMPALVTVSGFDTSFSVNGGTFSGQARTVENGDRVQLRMTAASGPLAAQSATIDVGGVTDTWKVTTGLR